MKKLSMLLLLAVCSFSLAACKKKEDNAAESKPAATTPADPAKPADTPATPPAAPAAPAAIDIPADKMPEACAQLKAVIDKIAACEKLPQETRDGMAKSWALMTQSLKDWDRMGADNQATVTASCKNARDAMATLANDC